eukprot:TRINITY_DN38947_c0_g1_i1.p1 TRINITY_DN38947_c0_g1~~TRINITY_DN38947_c0_g1_i1.p1  ORF type:complete len:198 (-),score=58.32 TRINITY_DN38947_c0_g1_i1:61-654(-)
MVATSLSKTHRFVSRSLLTLAFIASARFAGGQNCQNKAICSAKMSCKLAVVARRDLNMSIGKLAAQVGHAVHDAVREASAEKMEAWEEDGSMIVVLAAESQQALEQLEQAAQKLKVPTSDVRDEGLTELDDDTFTALAVGPDFSDRVNAVTGKLDVYRDIEKEELHRKVEAAEAEASELRKRLAAAEATIEAMTRGE